MLGKDAHGQLTGGANSRWDSSPSGPERLHIIYLFFISSAPLRSVSCLRLKRKKKTNLALISGRRLFLPETASNTPAESWTGGNLWSVFLLFFFNIIFLYKFFFSLINCINKSRWDVEPRRRACGGNVQSGHMLLHAAPDLIARAPTGVMDAKSAELDCLAVYFSK